MSIDSWQRPLDWADYPEKSEQQWEIDSLKALCLFLKKHTDYLFTLNLEDETCLYVTVSKEQKPKAEIYVNRGAKDEALFSMFSGIDEDEYHGSDKNKILEHINSSTGFLKAQ